MSREEDLAKAVLERAQKSDGRKLLACAEAFELARQVGAEPMEIGRICNEHDVKICHCQLGCFG